ncbi:hypothetical protein MMC30_005141 [Trapelia coarctata]|nr:hypothetical protein [Trapelia coarctata]
MANPWAIITVLSSLAVRSCAYIFLRWIPGHHFPPIVLYSLITYLISFAITSKETSPYEIVADEVDIIVAAPEEKRERAPLLPSRSTRSKSSAKRVAEPEEEKEVKLDIEETIVLGERDSQILKTLFWGLPSPNSQLWSLVTLAINLTSALFVVDMIYRGPLLYPSHDVSFARVGYVSDTNANILIREPDTSNLPLYISYRKASEPTASPIVEDPWKTVEQIYWLSKDTDFTIPLTIPHLHPSTTYQYALSNNLTGTFTTAPRPGRPSPDSNKLTFLTSSCLKPQFPYSPLAHPLSIPGLHHLATWLPRLHASFMLFLGDFIYIDVPHRLGNDAETYRAEYRRVYASPSWGPVSSVPWLHVIDDHEIANDWDRGTNAPYPAAVDPWNLYHASVNPPSAVKEGNVTYYAFTHGPASFFLLDTRRYRTPEFEPKDPLAPEKSMLGPTQLAALLAWLRQPPPAGVHWKIVISSVPFTRNWRFGSQDTWAGYLAERQIILEAMWDVSAASPTRIVILSGDRHEFAATAFPPPVGGRWPAEATVHEFSTSPLSMFYLPVRTYKEVEGEGERCVKYLPDGNSKFGAVEIENLKGGEMSTLKFRLFVDGEEVWGYSINSPPAGGKGRWRDSVWG